MILPDFPAFAPLALENKDDYEHLIAEYPPFSDIAFATLHIWWNLEGKLELSMLNGNIVINYQLEFDPENSGLCLVGKDHLEDSVRTIFEHLRQNQQPARLVHVPQFVADKLSRQDFVIEEELDYNEYILDSKALAKLEGSLHGKNRRRVNRFLREVEGRQVEFKQLDLESPEVQKELFEAILAWENTKSSSNDPDKTERDAIQKTLSHARHLGVKHVGLYIDGELHGIVLFHETHDKNHYVLHHIKVNYSTPYIFYYIVHHVANQAAQAGVNYLNMEMDLGIQNLREHKLALRPVDFFRKFTIKPL